MKIPYVTLKNWLLEGWSVDIGNSVRYELADLRRRVGLSRNDQVRDLLEQLRREGLLTLVYVGSGHAAEVKLTASGETEGRKMRLRQAIGFNPA